MWKLCQQNKPFILERDHDTFEYHSLDHHEVFLRRVPPAFMRGAAYIIQKFGPTEPSENVMNYADMSMVFADPNTVKFKQTRKRESCSYLIMLPFTLEEIRKFHRLFFPHISNDLVMENFNMAGGVPRLVFHYSSLQLQCKIRRAFQLLPGKFDGSNCYRLLDCDESYLLVHLLPDPACKDCDEDSPLMAIQLCQELGFRVNYSIRGGVHCNQSHELMSACALQYNKCS